MSRALLSLLLVAALFLWAGLVVGISFLEAPLKFTAPHITTVLGVGIGRIVFAALNKLELTVCAVALLSAAFLRTPARVWWGLGVLSLVLLVQTVGLLPALDARALALQAGWEVAPTLLHPSYIGLEITKLLTLLYTGSTAFYWLLQPAPAAVGAAQPRPAVFS